MYTFKILRPEWEGTCKLEDGSYPCREKKKEWDVGRVICGSKSLDLYFIKKKQIQKIVTFLRSGLLIWTIYIVSYKITHEIWNILWTGFGVSKSQIGTLALLLLLVQCKQVFTRMTSLPSSSITHISKGCGRDEIKYIHSIDYT